MRYFLFLYINACLVIQTSSIEAFTSPHDEQQEGLGSQIAHNVTTQMADLLAKLPDIQPYLQPLSSAYLDYRLSGAFADFERFAAATNLHAPTHYYPVIEALCGKSLANGEESSTKMLEFLNADTADQMMEFLPLDKLVSLRLFSPENYISVIRELKRRLTAYITGVPEAIAKNVDAHRPGK